ncbi:MAG TPA: RT0821/Lpp0805 family surface protein [Gammaproteobacteria bacterium]|nr:RT0821/Lpp0805 family surface protein [Gammaproteobacteria bacterium]
MPAAKGDKQVAGTFLGGVGGALIGSTIGAGSGQVIATAAGAVLGALVGNQMGQQLDETDTIVAHRSFYRATEGEIGHPHYWCDETTGTSGYIRPIRDGMYQGLYCREFQTTIYIDGRTERLYGTACRLRDGRWVPVT